MKEKIIKIWNNAVWSKVIAVAIVALVSFIYLHIDSYISTASFATTFQNTIHIKVDLWVVILLLLLVYVITSLVLYFVYKLKPKSVIGYTAVQIAHDEKLFAKLKDQLPTNGSIQFLRTNNFAGSSFLWEELDDFEFIMRNSDDTDLMFIDQELEMQRAELFKKIRAYRFYLASKAFTIDTDRRATIPPEWEEEQPERFYEVVNTLHDSAGEICKEYDQFMLSGKHKYGL